MVVITTSQPPLRCAFNTFCCNTLGSCAPRTKFSATAPVRSCSWRHLPGKGKPPAFYFADFEVENKHDDDRYHCIMKVEFCSLPSFSLWGTLPTGESSRAMTHQPSTSWPDTCNCVTSLLCSNNVCRGKTTT